MSDCGESSFWQLPKPKNNILNVFVTLEILCQVKDFINYNKNRVYEIINKLPKSMNGIKFWQNSDLAAFGMTANELRVLIETYNNDYKDQIKLLLNYLITNYKKSNSFEYINGLKLAHFLKLEKYYPNEMRKPNELDKIVDEIVKNSMDETINLPSKYLEEYGHIQTILIPVYDFYMRALK